MKTIRPLMLLFLLPTALLARPAKAPIVMSQTEQAHAILEASKLAAHLDSRSRDTVRAWLEAIERAIDRGKLRKSERLAADLQAILQVLTGARAVGVPRARAGLVQGPEDFLSPEELLNVEVVEPGVLTGGSQPKGRGWELLKRRGFRTIVNLRREDNSEEPIVRSLGLNYAYIPITDQTAPSRADVRQFLDIVREPANRPVYVHCAAGVGRTHTMIVAWRLERGMPLGEALSEARSYGHHKRAQVHFLRAWEKDGRTKRRPGSTQ